MANKDGNKKLTKYSGAPKDADDVVTLLLLCLYPLILTFASLCSVAKNSSSIWLLTSNKNNTPPYRWPSYLKLLFHQSKYVVVFFNLLCLKSSTCCAVLPSSLCVTPASMFSLQQGVTPRRSSPDEAEHPIRCDRSTTKPAP